MKKKILDAIAELFRDTTVSQQTTLNALREIRDDLDIRIDALEEDIKRNEKAY